MDYDHINNILRERFPELEKEIAEVDFFWYGEEPPQYCLYGLAFNQSGFFDELLLGESNPELITRVFDFFEEMATCEDIEVRNLLSVELLEYLWGNHKLLKVALKYMLPETRKLNETVQFYFKPFVDTTPPRS